MGYAVPSEREVRCGASSSPLTNCRDRKWQHEYHIQYHLPKPIHSFHRRVRKRRFEGSTHATQILQENRNYTPPLPLSRRERQIWKKKISRGRGGDEVMNEHISKLREWRLGSRVSQALGLKEEAYNTLSSPPIEFFYPQRSPLPTYGSKHKNGNQPTRCTRMLCVVESNHRTNLSYNALEGGGPGR